MNDFRLSLEKFLRPDSLQGNLISFALFVLAFETFKARIIEKPRVFFANGYDRDGPIVGPEYDRRIASLNKSPLLASLLWFKELGAIDQSDIDLVEGIRRHRNELVHELPKFVTEPGHEVDQIALESLVGVLDKIEKWWIINFEAATDPDLADQDIGPEQVVSGSTWILRVLFDVALGREPEPGHYHREFLKAASRKPETL